MIRRDGPALARRRARARLCSGRVPSRDDGLPDRAARPAAPPGATEWKVTVAEGEGTSTTDWVSVANTFVDVDRLPSRDETVVQTSDIHCEMSVCVSRTRHQRTTSTARRYSAAQHVCICSSRTMHKERVVSVCARDMICREGTN